MVTRNYCISLDFFKEVKDLPLKLNDILKNEKDLRCCIDKINKKIEDIIYKYVEIDYNKNTIIMDNFDLEMFINKFIEDNIDRILEILDNDLTKTYKKGKINMLLELENYIEFKNILRRIK